VSLSLNLDKSLCFHVNLSQIEPPADMLMINVVEPWLVCLHRWKMCQFFPKKRYGQIRMLNPGHWLLLLSTEIQTSESFHFDVVHLHEPCEQTDSLKQLCYNNI